MKTIKLRRGVKSSVRITGSIAEQEYFKELLFLELKKLAKKEIGTIINNSFKTQSMDYDYFIGGEVIIKYQILTKWKRFILKIRRYKRRITSE